MFTRKLAMTALLGATIVTGSVVPQKAQAFQTGTGTALMAIGLAATEPLGSFAGSIVFAVGSYSAFSPWLDAILSGGGAAPNVATHPVDVQNKTSEVKEYAVECSAGGSCATVDSFIEQASFNGHVVPQNVHAQHEVYKISQGFSLLSMTDKSEDFDPYTAAAEYGHEAANIYAQAVDNGEIVDPHAAQNRYYEALFVDAIYSSYQNTLLNQ